MSTIETIGETSTETQSLRAGSLFLALLAAMLIRLQDMIEKNRSRRALSALGDEQLKDIGLSRYDAFRESSRPFWD